MNDITIFNHLGNSIRVMTDKQCEPWFVAKDVCAILGLSNPRTSLALLDEDEKGVHTMDTPQSANTAIKGWLIQGISLFIRPQPSLGHLD